MTYIIEGIISSISVDKNGKILFTICGHEGYSIKIENKKYNILLQKEIINSSIVLSQDFQFSVNEENKIMLIQSNSIVKKAQISFEVKNDKKLSDNFTVGDFETSSITLLAN
ncbi:MAG: hypothetical protein SPL22_10380 [Treponema sp.]|uniref:hypothetical protein n=1 Tax=Treponema sp. TaxID=166 RepID=UPI002A908CE8|nr:hypothetical protein [Treponema sp.]MDY6398123.1 hypothetical protein [Treponema sp.]